MSLSSKVIYSVLACAFISVASLAEVTALPQSHFILNRGDYVIGYDGRTRAAAWVIEELTRESISGDAERAGISFKPDVGLPVQARATLEDYKGSGFDRGHMAAAANHKSVEAMKATFILSNAAPQLPQLNRGFWARLEKHVRELTNKYGKVTVITGPLFLPNTNDKGERWVRYRVIGNNDVAVPTHFFKIVKAEELIEAYVVPNMEVANDASSDNFRATVEKIESLSGGMFSDFLKQKR
jgi:endonuclease G